MFGKVLEVPQNEDTPFYLEFPYKSVIVGIYLSTRHTLVLLKLLNRRHAL